ncbi:MAG: beta-ketoacyl synthase N-terminal-like domain-containing protein, partial [Bacteroidota bacterium]
MGAEKNFVAIIGMSGLFPEAEDLDKFYDNLCKGHDAVREISETRLKYSTLYPFYNYQEIAHLDRVDQFDHAFFNLSKKEAECMDPGQRKLLELAAKAIMDAGYSLKTFKGSNTSVYLGGGVDSKYAKNIQEFDPSILTGNLNAMGAGRISYHLDLRGAAMMIGTACSSALAAVHHACHDIIGDEAEYALAGGFHVLYNFARKDEVNKLGTEALDGRAKAFDEKADGTGGGEGGGFVLLKRLDRAIRDNDNIHAVIRATACNQDGRTSNGLTAPSPTAQTAVITKAWKKAGIDPRSIEYIEAHGTGTKLGDPIEIQGITNAFGAFGINGDHRCAISSVKSNIGHLDNAAGIAGLIKCVLALKNGVHFPSVHFNKPNPFIDFEKSSTYVNSTFQPWVSKSGKRTAGVSSFGISGTNVHVVLEEAPSTRLAQARTEKHLLKISGKTLEAFRSNLAAVIDYLDKTDTELDHALYTLNAGRDDFKFREALLARSKSELISELRSLQKKDNASVQSFSEEDVQVIYLLSGEIIPGTVTNELKASSARFKEIFEDYASRLSKAPGAAASTVLTQLAIYKVMQEAGIAHHSIIATGIGKATRELIANEDNLLPVILRVENGDDDYKVPLDSDKLQAALAKIISTGKCVFVEIGEKHATLSNSLSKGQNEIPKPDVMVLMDGADLESAFVGLYNRGVIPDWKTHYQGRNMKKVSAPDYIFDPIRCWYKEPVEQPEKIFNSWFYDLEWMKREPLSRTTSVVKNWLMIMDNRGVGEALHQELLKQGHMVVPVYANGTFRKDKNGSYHISPASEADHIRLVDHLKLDGNLPDGIIHLGNCTAIDAMDDRLHERTLDEGLRSQFLFAKILDQKLSGSDFEFLMISSEACQVSDDDHTFFPLRAGALGFLRGLCSEYPLVKAKVIDVDASVTDTATVVQNILSEMNVETDCKVVAYRKHKRYVQALAPVKQHSIEQVAGPIMVKNKTYLITGGLNGLGYEIARALSEHVGCSLILTGRTKLPD